MFHREWLHFPLKNASVQQPLSIEPLLFPLPSRAKPRDLQFRGPFVERQNYPQNELSSQANDLPDGKVTEE
jgi:hypothetical protein